MLDERSNFRLSELFHFSNAELFHFQLSIMADIDLAFEKGF